MPGRSPGYEALAARLATRRTAPARLAAGDRFELDGIAIDVLWPDAARSRGAVRRRERGQRRSIVLLGTFEGRRFLLTGDAEADVEALLVARGLPPVDVLKAGHHGSRTSTTDALVDATRPRVAAISVGAGNDYGHPSREVLARLVAAGAIVLRTDEVGTIDVALDAGGVEVRTTRPAPGRARPAPIGPRPAGHCRGADARPSPVLARPGARPGLPYDRRDVGPIARGRRRPPPLARPARLAPPPRAGRRRGRRLARGALRRPRRARGPGARRGRRAPPRRRQGAPGDDPAGPCRTARARPPGSRARGHGGARTGGRGPPGDAPRRRRGGRVARDGAARGAPRRLRRQARRPAPRADGRAVRGLAPPLPGRLERRGRRRRPGAGRPRSSGPCAAAPASTPARSAACAGRAALCARRAGAPSAGAAA